MACIVDYHYADVDGNDNIDDDIINNDIDRDDNIDNNNID